MVTQNIRTYKSTTINNRKVKVYTLKEFVKNVPVRVPLLRGIKNE